MLQAVLDFINSFVTIFYNILTWVLDSLSSLFLSFFQILWDGFLAIVYGLVSTLSLGSLLTDVAASWGLLDANTHYLVSISGLPEGCSLIGVAYGVRLLLNLIPASLTRV